MSIQQERRGAPSARRMSSAKGRLFPVLGSRDQQVSGGTRARYFVTGPFTRSSDWSTAPLIGTVHAKEVGRTVTACGQAITSWTTLFEVPFRPGALQGACPACREHVSLDKEAG